MSDWTDAGLPLPLTSDYGYGISSMLLRTPMESGIKRQRRFRDYDRKEFSLTYDLTSVELTALEGLLRTKRYGPYTAPLIDGTSGSIDPVDKTVRPIASPAINRQGPDHYEVTLVVEDGDQFPVAPPPTEE